MIKTVFVDVSRGDYKIIKEYPYNIQCYVGEYVDFDNFNPYADDFFFKIINIIHLPNEGKKFVEVKHFHTKNIQRKGGNGTIMDN
jgi:hypothetical protein